MRCKMPSSWPCRGAADVCILRRLHQQQELKWLCWATAEVMPKSKGCEICACACLLHLTAKGGCLWDQIHARES